MPPQKWKVKVARCVLWTLEHLPRACEVEGRKQTLALNLTRNGARPPNIMIYHCGYPERSHSRGGRCGTSGTPCLRFLSSLVFCDTSLSRVCRSKIRENRCADLQLAGLGRSGCDPSGSSDSAGILCHAGWQSLKDVCLALSVLSRQGQTDSSFTWLGASSCLRLPTEHSCPPSAFSKAEACLPFSEAPKCEYPSLPLPGWHGNFQKHPPT